MGDPHTIGTLAELETLYGAASANSLAKETDHLTKAYQAWLSAAPFFALASTGPDGLDCSPRGDANGQLVHVLDSRTLAIPDRRGNNRIDTLRNIVTDPRVGLLFLIPGIDEAMRVNGQARISTDPALLQRFDMNGKLPKTVIVVAIEAVYFQCARAIKRSRLWSADAQIPREAVPRAGQLLQSTVPDFDGEAYDAALYDRQMDSLY